MEKEMKRQRVECYTRVMGYVRPVNFFNEGKKSEFYSRKYYKSHPNTDFNKKYSKEKAPTV